ncbi:MAG TPA: hypothetical protein VGG48_01830 [Rhizomicrobium sp.]|jgi:hypothetical protein
MVAAADVARAGCCANCTFFEHRKALADGVQAPPGFDADRGGCHRFPDVVPKHGNDWCGEFKMGKSP